MSSAQLVSPSFASPEQQIAEITGRLARRYPREQISRSDLETRVRRFYREFDTAHVRTFVAILVERLVRRSIDDR
jgi:hypothetical protein